MVGVHYRWQHQIEIVGLSPYCIPLSPVTHLFSNYPNWCLTSYGFTLRDNHTHSHLPINFHSPLLSHRFNPSSRHWIFTIIVILLHTFTHLPHSVSHTFTHLLASPDELAPFWKLCSYSYTNILLAQLSPSLYHSSSFQTNTNAMSSHFTHLTQTFKFQFPWNSFHRFPFTPFPQFSVPTV